jgi:hypothetical protein
LVAFVGLSIFVLQRPARTITEPTAPAPAVNEPKSEARSETAPAASAPPPVRKVTVDNSVADTASVEAKTGERAKDSLARPEDELLFSNLAAVGRPADANSGFDAGSNLADFSGQVLNNFRMIQTGAKVQFQDADGSQYSGSLSVLNSGTNSFRASGVNRTLRMPVVFTGNVYRADNNLAVVAQQAASRARALVPEQQVRLQGQALVGDTNQIPVDAQAAPVR